MFKTTLFLGLPITPTFEISLKQANPGLLALFTKGGSDYLEYCDVRGQRFLGKTLGDSAELGRIELVEANICSLISRLVPDYSSKHTPLVIVTCPNLA